ncbi:hypothetical protein HAALTHF_52760n [Vreelandella aquamarina]|nr:hypothetical protein HAALTHF_52760n [Halomonas axialensis]
MSMTYGHSPTESVVAMLKDTDRDTGLDLELLEDIAGYFREVRKSTLLLKVRCAASIRAFWWPRSRAACSPTWKAS